VSVADFVWDLFGGFAEELKISQDSVINEFIACELRPAV
jgi:hypothetical protein